MDPRIARFIKGWTAWEIYRGKKVIIPDLWLDRWFRYAPEDKLVDVWEEQAYLNLGWLNCDEEVHIAIGIFGEDVVNPKGTVMGEIARMGGAEIHVVLNGREIVKFPPYRIGVAAGYYPLILMTGGKVISQNTIALC